MDIHLEREYAIDNMGDSIGQAIEKATDEDRLEDAKALFQEWCVLDNIAESENYQFVFLRNFTIPEGLQQCHKSIYQSKSINHSLGYYHTLKQ